MKEMRCPFCLNWFGYYTPQGCFYADMKCGRCHLQFVIEMPESIMVYQGTMLNLLMKRWGLVLGKAWTYLEKMPVVMVGGTPLIPWEIVIAVSPPAGRSWETPYTEQQACR